MTGAAAHKLPWRCDSCGHHGLARGSTVRDALGAAILRHMAIAGCHGDEERIRVEGDSIVMGESEEAKAA